MIRRLPVLILILLGLLPLPILTAPPVARAASATIFFSPQSTTVGVGYNTNVLVSVKSDIPVYSVDVTIAFDPTQVLAIEANANNTVFPIAAQPATVDSSTGTAKFRVAVPAPGYQGSNGGIGTLVFQGAKIGTSALRVTDAAVIACTTSAADCRDHTSGFKNIYAGTINGQIIVDKSTNPLYTTSGSGGAGGANGGSGGNGGTGSGVTGPVPVVNSPTHPDPSKWYTNRNITFAWEAGVTDYSYTFDQDQQGDAPKTSRGSATTTTVSGVADGVWYFHVRAEAGGNWGPTTTFRVQIDGTPPETFPLTLDPASGGSALPLVKFAAADKPSGIEKYELQLDDGPFVTTLSPYQMPQVKPGKHHLVVKATDRAGNQTTSEVDVTVMPLDPTPKITNPANHGSVALGGGQTIEGSGPPKASIQLFANDQYVASVTADDKGHFAFKVDDYFDPGTYTFKVKAVMPHHLDSAYSDGISIQIAGVAGLKIGKFTLPATLTIAIYILLVLGLLGVLIYLFIRWQKERQKERLALQKLELITEEDPATAPAASAGPATPTSGTPPAA